MSANIIENLTVCEIKEVISTPLYQTNTFSLTDSCQTCLSPGCILEWGKPI